MVILEAFAGIAISYMLFNQKLMKLKLISQISFIISSNFSIIFIGIGFVLQKASNNAVIYWIPLIILIVVPFIIAIFIPSLGIFCK